MDISGLFSGTVTLLKRRFGLFVLITLVPVIFTAVMIGAVIAAAFIVIGLSREGWQGVTAGVLLGGVGLLVVVIGGVLVQLKSYAMMVLAAYEIAQGLQPSFSSLLAGTKGYLPRLAPLIALGFAVIVVIYGGFGVLIVWILNSATADINNIGVALATIAGIALLSVLVLVPLALFIGTKLLYVVPAIALEQVDGIAALKRSWQLTNGAFWRTLGYYLLGSLAASTLTFVANLISQMLSVPLSLSSSSAQNSTDALVAFAAMLPILAISSLLQLAAQIIVVPFIYTYITCMFLDQVRRSEMPPPVYAAPGYPPAGYYPPAAPGQPANWQAPTAPPAAPPAPPAQWQTPPNPTYDPQPPADKDTPPAVS